MQPPNSFICCYLEYYNSYPVLPVTEVRDDRFKSPHTSLKDLRRLRYLIGPNLCGPKAIHSKFVHIAHRVRYGTAIPAVPNGTPLLVQYKVLFLLEA